MAWQEQLREIEREGLEKIGSGVTGTVYRLDEDHILKVYKKEVSAQEVYRQAKIARYLYEAGVPTARTDEIVRCGECFGVIAEYLKATPLVRYIGRNRDLRMESAAKMGRLLAQVHTMELQDDVFPTLGEMYRDVILRFEEYLSDEQVTKMIAFLEALPGKKRVLHGDFHENNIMVRDGEYLLIDLDGMCMGSPLFELAQTYSVYRQNLPETIVKALGLTKELIDAFLAVFTSTYFEEMGTPVEKDRLQEMDALFTDMAQFNLFLFPMLTSDGSDPGALREYVDRRFPELEQLMEDLAGRFAVVPA